MEPFEIKRVDPEEPHKGGARGNIVGRIDLGYSMDPRTTEYVTAQLRARNPTVQTHRHVDTDAAFSVALWAHLIGSEVDRLTIHFAGSDEKVKLGTVGLDVSGGLKGLESSCFEQLSSYLPEEERIALSGLVAHVTLQDRGKLRQLPDHLNVTTLARQISVQKIGGRSDLEVCRWASDYLQAILSQEINAIRAQVVIDTAPRYGRRGEIILLEEAGRAAGFLACQRRDIDFVVYSDQGRVGITRANHVEDVALNQLLEGKLPLGKSGRGFFFHEDGFCVTWGSKKAPRIEPAPISARELAEALTRELESIERRATG